MTLTERMDELCTGFSSHRRVVGSYRYGIGRSVFLKGIKLHSVTA